MQLPFPEVSHDLSIDIGGAEYKFVATAVAVPLLSYYAIVMTFDLEDKFYHDFEIEDVFITQFYPVENIQSAISNMKALQTNLEWIAEQSYRAFQEAEWEFIAPINKTKVSE